MYLTTSTLIIGASAAGLAAAACLQKERVPFILLEKHSQVGNSWRNHYDRLHLHTSKKWSALPYKKFGASVPVYPSRQDMINYLDSYAAELNIHPVFNIEVLSVKKLGEYWITKTNKETYQSKFVIVATGRNHKPKMADFAGLSSFKGSILHSSQYKNGKEFEGKNVLVVGFGNSGCEQAICLHEHGARVAISVRSPVNVIPRDIFGFPALEIGKLTSLFPNRVRDKINAPLLKLLVGDITRLGLKKSAYGPLEQIQKLNRIPLLDIGTIKLIKQGHITVFHNIVKIEGNTIYFEDKKQWEADAIILATGYEHNLESFVQVSKDRFDDLNKAVDKQPSFGKDGLYFCGFYVSPTGMLREITMDARKISCDIVTKMK